MNNGDRSEGYSGDSSGIKQLVGGISVLAFLADILLLLVAISTILGKHFLSSSQPVAVQFLLIAVIYAFAIGSFLYARSALGDTFDGFVYIAFGWGYVLLAAGLIFVVARTFVLHVGFGGWDSLTYAMAAIIISSFGIIIALVVNEKVRYFSIPFIQVALWQVYLWVWRVASSQGVAQGWNLVGSVLLFVFVVLLIVFLLLQSDSASASRDYWE